jgi:hypothetical protein
MTYISAFQCVGGVVMVADTQESYEKGKLREEIEYVEKLYVPQNLPYPLAVGGAGIEEPIEAFTLELCERVEKNPPATADEFRNVAIAAIEEIHSSDKRISSWPKSFNTTCCIVAAKPPDDDFVILKTTGKRVSWRKQEPIIVGYNTPANKALLMRLYRPTMTVAQGIIMGAYLVTQSKLLNPGVGGPTRIATVASHGAFIEDEKYVGLLEKRAKELVKAFDDLFLVAADVAVSSWSFDKHLEEFQEAIKKKRFEYEIETSSSLFEFTSNPNWRGDGYGKLPDGTSMSNALTNRCIMFRNGTPWLVLPDGYTEDGRSKIRLIPLNSSEAKGKVSFEQPIQLMGVSIEQLARPQGRRLVQKTLSDNADKLRDILRSDRNTAQGWTQLKQRIPASTQNLDSAPSDTEV